MERSSVIGGARLVQASMIGGHRAGSWSYKTARTTDSQKYFRLMRHHRNLRLDQRVLKLLTTQQKDGDCPVENVVPGLLERSRSRRMDWLRKFTAVDNHEAVKVGDLHRETRSKKVVRPRFTTDFSGAVIRKGAGELTCERTKKVLRTFSDTSNVGDKKDGVPPLVDTDWHVFWKPIFQGIVSTRIDTSQ